MLNWYKVAQGKDLFYSDFDDNISVSPIDIPDFRDTPISEIPQDFMDMNLRGTHPPEATIPATSISDEDIIARDPKVLYAPDNRFGGFIQNFIMSQFINNAKIKEISIVRDYETTEDGGYKLDVETDESPSSYVLENADFVVIYSDFYCSPEIKGLFQNIVGLDLNNPRDADIFSAKIGLYVDGDKIIEAVIPKYILEKNDYMGDCFVTIEYDVKNSKLICVVETNFV